MDSSLVNQQEWEEFKSMTSPELLVELLGAYLDDSPQLLEQIRTGLASGDIDVVRRAAHSLKSNSASFGANGLAESSRDLEFLARGGTLAGGEQKLAIIEAKYAQISAWLKEIIDECKRNEL